MPALPSVPQVVKVIISSTRSDANVENILHVHYSGSVPDSATLSTWLSTIVEPATATLFNDEGSTDLKGVEIEAIDLSSPTGASATVTFTATGVRTGDFAPASACVISSWEIIRRYRGGHPRTYWPFGTAGTYAATSSKLWDPGFIADVSLKLNTWTNLMTSGTVGSTTFDLLVNVSYIDKAINPVPPYRRTTPVVDTLISHVEKQRICSQRRRLGKLLG
jgi:hypothetical protein